MVQAMGIAYEFMGGGLCDTQVAHRVACAPVVNEFDVILRAFAIWLQRLDQLLRDL